MIDLIVHTPGGNVQCVSGVNESTTCSQIVYALAHAIRQKGSFALVGRTDGASKREYRFIANERPYEFVQKSAHHGTRIEFELLRLDDEERSASLEYEGDVEGNASANSSTTTLNEFFNCQQKQSMQNRPPPPDYNELMAERCNSLRRGISSSKKPCPLTFLNIPNFSFQDLCARTFSRPDLEALVEVQEKTLTAQKGELVRVELTLLDSDERALVQLRKQHNNLQTVLNSMRNANWPDRIGTESAAAERLHTAIAAMRTAQAEKKR
uniref:Ras-associating domain-containing protein n=1 Tax=Globodera pallida TaxID=36090 RepID=A0A183CCD9_GLOPA